MAPWSLLRLLMVVISPNPVWSIGTSKMGYMFWKLRYPKKLDTLHGYLDSFGWLRRNRIPSWSCNTYSRLQKVGIWAWDALCWCSFFSRLWGWRTVKGQATKESAQEGSERGDRLGGHGDGEPLHVIQSCPIWHFNQLHGHGSQDCQHEDRQPWAHADDDRGRLRLRDRRQALFLGPDIFQLSGFHPRLSYARKPCYICCDTSRMARVKGSRRHAVAL